MCVAIELLSPIGPVCVGIELLSPIGPVCVGIELLSTYWSSVYWYRAIVSLLVQCVLVKSCFQPPVCVGL